MGILEEINEKLDKLLAAAGTKAKVTAVAAEEDADEGEEDAPKKKRTRTPDKKPKAATLETVKAKLKKVLDDVGRKDAVALLKKFKAEKVGDLEEEQYEDFVKACDAALAAAADDGDDDDDDDVDL